MDNTLKGNEAWKDLTAFAPGIRTSIALIRMHSNDDVRAFCQQWRADDITFQGAALRAGPVRTPEERKSNTKIYNLSDFVRKTFPPKEFDADFKRAKLWGDEGIIAVWSAEEECFKWNDDVLSAGGYTFDKSAALIHTAD